MVKSLHYRHNSDKGELPGIYTVVKSLHHGHSSDKGELRHSEIHVTSFGEKYNYFENDTIQLNITCDSRVPKRVDPATNRKMQKICVHRFVSRKINFCELFYQLEGLLALQWTPSRW